VFAAPLMGGSCSSPGRRHRLQRVHCGRLWQRRRVPRADRRASRQADVVWLRRTTTRVRVIEELRLACANWIRSQGRYARLGAFHAHSPSGRRFPDCRFRGCGEYRFAPARGCGARGGWHMVHRSVAAASRQPHGGVPWVCRLWCVCVLSLARPGDRSLALGAGGGGNRGRRGLDQGRCSYEPNRVLG
jgi:hypothetical protein